MTDKEDMEYYIVGGWVRDTLLGKEPKDKDYVVVGETEESMKERGFKPIEATSFPVFQDENGDEWALARKERKIGEGYHGFETFTEDVSLMDDLERRDFTINAMALNPETNELYAPDVEQSSRDLENGVIRHQTDAFKEDPIRVLRAARFAARYNFEIEHETIVEARKAVEELNEVPGERIGEEVIKGLEQAQKPSLFMEKARNTYALREISPELWNLAWVDAGPDKHHKEPSCWDHTLMVMDRMAEFSNVNGVLMAMIHDVGKTVTDEMENENHGGHDKEGIPLAKKIADRWKLSKNRKQKMVDACKEHMRIHNVPLEAEHSMRENKVIEMVDRLDTGKGATQKQLLDLAKADGLGRIPPTVEDVQSIRKRMALAREALEVVDAEYAVNKRDSEIEDYEGENLGQMITSDRVHYMKKRQKEEYSHK